MNLPPSEGPIESDRQTGSETDEAPMREEDRDENQEIPPCENLPAGMERESDFSQKPKDFSLKSVFQQVVVYALIMAELALAVTALTEYDVPATRNAAAVAFLLIWIVIRKLSGSMEA